jgi:hypothetical protein
MRKVIAKTCAAIGKKTLSQRHVVVDRENVDPTVVGMSTRRKSPPSPNTRIRDQDNSSIRESGCESNLLNRHEMSGDTADERLDYKQIDWCAQAAPVTGTLHTEEFHEVFVVYKAGERWPPKMSGVSLFQDPSQVPSRREPRDVCGRVA